MRPEFIIRKRVRLRVNFTVGEDSIAVLTIQSPLSLRQFRNFLAGLAAQEIMPKARRLRMFSFRQPDAELFTGIS
jgi:hypothetical protein